MKMDLKEAVDLYRDVLQRYSQGFSLDEVLGSLAEALGARLAVLFIRKDMSSFLEPRLAWRLSERQREGIKNRMLPVELASRFPARRYLVLERERLGELGIESLAEIPTDRLVLFPVKSHTHLRAVLLAEIPLEEQLPEQQSFKAAAVGAILERMVELFSFDRRDERKDEDAESAPFELGVLSSYIIDRTDYARAASLSLDLLIKLLNMDGGTVHRVRGTAGTHQHSLITSRGWGGMPEIIEHLFENNLIDLLQSLRDSGEMEFCLDAGRIAEYFPGVKPYFHANQVKSFLLTPIFEEGRLVGLLNLFGKTYTVMEPQDMDLLVQLSRRLGALFAEEEADEWGARVQKSHWDFPALAEDLTGISEGAGGLDDFLSSAVRVTSIELGASMAFIYCGEEDSLEGRFHWYADSVYGGESVFKPTAGLTRMASHLQRMAVVKPDNPAMREMPAFEQAVSERLVLLLVPARERGLYLIAGFYLHRDRKLTRAEIDSLSPLASLVLGLARGLMDRDKADDYRRSLEILTEIEGDLTASEYPSHMLRLLARGGRELLDCDRAAIVVIDEDRGSFEGAVETESGSEALGLHTVIGREIALALERGQALYSPESSEAADDSRGEEASKSIIAVPLIGRKGRLGALVFEKMDQDGYFGEFKRRLAHFLAGQAVSVLESHMEGARLREAEDETRALLRISRRLASSQSLEELGGGLYKEFNKLMGVEFLIFSLYGKSGIKRLAYWRGEKEDAAAFEELLDTQGPLMLALARAGKLVRNNLNTVLRGPGEDELALKGIRSYMAAALQGEDTRGMLLLGSTLGGVFAERESALLERSVSIINSSLAVPLHYEAMQGRIRLLEEMCRSQEERIQTKTDLINMASHEIRHPLTLIMGFSEVMRDYSDMLDARESREVVDKLNKAADRLRRSVVNMMEVSRLESGKLTVKLGDVDLLKLLHSLVEELQARSIQHSIELAVESDSERIVADRDKLEVILFNLMDNAAKYSPPGSRIEVFARRSGHEVHVGVRDQGQGISQEQLNYIFQPFKKGEGREYGTIKGMGLGLYIVNKLVEAHGGRIEVRSEHGRGSTFIARLPQPDSGERPGVLEDRAMEA